MGLEVHAQIRSESKLFSAAPTDFGGEPNTQVNLFDAALPGTLPVCNLEVIRQAARTAFALESTVHSVSVFERKNYFYADLPAGYQISQFQQPLATGGQLLVECDGDDGGGERPIRIERLHVEQDAGKSIHDRTPTDTFVDLNRAGVGLMEIVSQPDLRTPGEVGSYLRRLRSLVRAVGSCDGNMNEGSLRCDVNLSVRRPGDTTLGTRTETKNVNSVRFVMQAIELEARRQVALLESGGSVSQETRLFDSHAGESRSMRSKEEAHDYRYFPDPDLMPLVLEDAFLAACRDSLPELPLARGLRFVEALGLPPISAALLVDEPQNADYFEALLGDGKRDAKLCANWVITNVFSALNEAGGLSVDQAPVSAARLGELLDRTADGSISGRQAKEVFEVMWQEKRSAAEVIRAQGMTQISDDTALRPVVEQILDDNASQVQDYISGKNENVLGWFVGQVMKNTGGKANPKLTKDLVRECLEARR